VDREKGKVVALKRLSPVTDDAMARMAREIQVQSRLSHPAVMPVLRHSNRNSWYSMPLARQSVKDLPTPVQDSVLLEIAVSTLEALVAAHEHRYVHRDITPSNILDIGTERSQWVLSDWGLVRRHGLTTVTRTAPGEFGTAGFAAPETWSDAHRADERSDIYSLGRVVAWALTGYRLIPNVPLVPDGRWASFVRSTTAMRAEDRPQTAVAALQLLQSILAQRAPLRGGGAVPQDTIEAIKAEAQDRYPADFSTRKFVIDSEVKAWEAIQSFAAHDVPPDVLSLVLVEARRRYPKDFSTQLFVIKRELEAWRELQSLVLEVPSDVAETIIMEARRRYPTDFSTQLFVVTREAEAWRDIQK